MGIQIRNDEMVITVSIIAGQLLLLFTVFLNDSFQIYFFSA